jgi:hypothetical protein
MSTSRFFHSISLRAGGPNHRISLPNSAAIISLLLALVLILAGCDHGTLYEQELGGSGKGAARWWKGNLHTHTLWSDGRDYPEMVVRWYKNNGWHFLALSDHNLLSQGQRWIDVTDRGGGVKIFNKYLEGYGDKWVDRRTVDGKVQVRVKPLNEFRCLFEEPGRFLLVQAEEITQKKAHLNAINLRQVIPPYEADSALEVMRGCVNKVMAQSEVAGRMMLAQINHPNFRWALRAEDITYVEDAKFFEIYNGHPSVHNYGDEHHVGTERMWDIILTRRLAELNLPVIYGTATDDAHEYHKWGPQSANPGRGWVMVSAAHLTPESLIEAMEAGDFYASTGVVLKDVVFDGKTLKVIIKPQTGVSYATQFIGTMRGYNPESRPVAGADGVEIQTTRIYSDDIGKVLAEAKGTVARYVLTGKEIYVRAKVISTRPMDNPAVAGDVEVAWIEPVVPDHE